MEWLGATRDVVIIAVAFDLSEGVIVVVVENGAFVDGAVTVVVQTIGFFGLADDRVNGRRAAGDRQGITEIPVELIREIVTTKVMEVVGKRRGGGPAIDVSKLVGDAANVAVADKLRPIEQRLAARKAAACGSCACP